MENFSTFTGVFHIVENGSLCSEPFKHFCCFVSESGFFMSTIFCTLTSDSSKGFNKVDVLGAVHYVCGQVFCDVHKLGCFVGVKVGVYVRSLADCCSCTLDGVVEKQRVRAKTARIHSLQTPVRSTFCPLPR